MDEVKRLSAIEGQVVDPRGRPVADATVMIQESDQSHHDIALLTDEQGNFRFQDLPPGRYTVAAHGGGEVPGTASTVVAPGRVARVRIVTPSS